MLEEARRYPGQHFRSRPAPTGPVLLEARRIVLIVRMREFAVTRRIYTKARLDRASTWDSAASIIISVRWLLPQSM